MRSTYFLNALFSLKCHLWFMNYSAFSKRRHLKDYIDIVTYQTNPQTTLYLILVSTILFNFCFWVIYCGHAVDLLHVTQSVYFSKHFFSFNKCHSKHGRKNMNDKTLNNLTNLHSI